MISTLGPSIAVLWLLCWGAIAITIARSAERSAMHAVLPAPWASIASTVALAGVAVIARPLAEAVLCGTACIALVAAAASDDRTGYLFDAITLPSAILVSAIAIGNGMTERAAAGVLLIVGTFGPIVAFSRGRLMGLGDVKAMFAIAVAFGPTESAFAIFAACASGIALSFFSGKRTLGVELRFGPHLAAGSSLALVVGRSIAHLVSGAS